MSTTSEEPGARLQEALTSWAMHLAPAEIQESRYQVAFRAIDRALAATIRYMELRRAGKPQDQNSERQLTELWMEASHALSPIDETALAKVVGACRKRGISVSNSRAPAWFSIAGVCIAAVTVLFLMWPGARTSDEE